MSDDPNLRRAKELAARSAFDAYGRKLLELMREQGIPLSELGDTGHSHVALLLDYEGGAVGVICRWDFVTPPDDVADLLRRHGKAEGQG